MIYDDQQQRDETPKSLFNPLTKEVAVEVFNDDNSKQTIILPPLESVTFPTYLANILLKHLITAVGYKEGAETEQEFQEIQAKIEHHG